MKDETTQTRRDLLTLFGAAGGGLALAQGLTKPAQAAAAPAAGIPLKIEVPTEESAKPYGALLGAPFPTGGGPLAFGSPTGMKVWSQHVFDPGPGGQTDVVWVNHVGNSPMITNLEQHHLTEQAIVPLTGDIVHIVCLSGQDGLPDVSTIKAFRMAPGIGICMAKDVWHASRSRGIINMMLSRYSTSVDTANFRGHHSIPAMKETKLADITPVRIVDPI